MSYTSKIVLRPSVPLSKSKAIPKLSKVFYSVNLAPVKGEGDGLNRQKDLLEARTIRYNHFEKSKRNSMKSVFEKSSQKPPKILML